MLRYLFIGIFLLQSNIILAHTLKPAYLNIQATGKSEYSILWKVPIHDNKVLKITPIFPPICNTRKKNFYSIYNSDMIDYYWTINCKKSLLGQIITIENLEKEMSDVILHFTQDNISNIKHLNPTNPSTRIKINSSSWTVFKEYTSLGVKHILLGYDHLLFVLGLLFLIVNLKMLIKTITAFTLAHSVTLTMTVLGYVHLNSVFIEAMIALSIMILAVEIIYSHYGSKGVSSKYPWGVAFVFGLLHGFGFAAVLTELGLPQNHIFLALFFFNTGIEIGQLLFIWSVILLYYIVRNKVSINFLTRSKILITYVIASVATFWFIERIVLIF